MRTLFVVLLIGCASFSSSLLASPSDLSDFEWCKKIDEKYHEGIMTEKQWKNCMIAASRRPKLQE